MDTKKVLEIIVSKAHRIDSKGDTVNFYFDKPVFFHINKIEYMTKSCLIYGSEVFRTLTMGGLSIKLKDIDSLDIL